jgi:hypothetical protein
MRIRTKASRSCDANATGTPLIALSFFSPVQQWAGPKKVIAPEGEYSVSGDAAMAFAAVACQS